MDPLEIICLHEELYACQPLALTQDRQPRVLQLPDKMCSAYLAGLVQVIEWPFEDGALQALVRPYKATVAYKFDRTVSQHLSYYTVHLYCGIAALAALPLWRHCRFFGRHCRCDEFRRCHVLTLSSRVQTTACKQLLILVHLSLNISKTIWQLLVCFQVRGAPGEGQGYPGARGRPADPKSLQKPIENLLKSIPKGLLAQVVS